MKAARFHEYSAPFVIEDVPIPEAGSGQVLIKVAAAAHNPADVAVHTGAFKDVLPLELPHTPCVEVAGTIAALGPDVEDASVGDRVVAYIPLTAPGAAAEYVVAPAEVVAGAPATIPLADSAAFPATALTAYQALFEHGQVKAGQRVLVNGAGGTVGAYAVQLAIRAGAQVVATVSPSSAERVQSYSPAQTIDHTTQALAGEVDPVDLVVNLAPTPAEELLPLIKPGGRIVSATTPVSEAYVDDITGIRMGTRASREQLTELAKMIDDGDLTVWVGERRPLEDINDVHAGLTHGKTILIP